jgi:hypothetical protein
MRKKANGNGAKGDVGNYVRISFCEAADSEEIGQKLKVLARDFAAQAGKNGGASIISIKPDAHADGVYCVRVKGDLSPAQVGVLREHRYG